MIFSRSDGTEVLKHFILGFCLLERFEEVKEFPVGCYKKLMGSADTDYKMEMFSLRNKEAKSRTWTELGLAMKDKVIRFEVLAEDEWEAKLNDMLQA